jgi:hypothetical protein
MPVAPVPVTTAQFTSLMNNISDQATQMNTIAGIAQSGLEYVTLLDVTQPELDLLTPFYNHLLNVESSTALGLFSNVTKSLNNHIVQIATLPAVGDQSARLNSYFSDNPGTTVTSVYATISSGGGYYIESQYVIL